MTLSIKSVLVLVCAALAALSVSAQNPGGNPEARKMKNPVAASPESIKAGQQLFQKNCRFCHGADAKGNGPMAPEGTQSSPMILVAIRVPPFSST